MKKEEKLNRYLFLVLEQKNRYNDATMPMRDAFLLALDDYYKKVVDIYDLSNFANILWRLEYFTENIEGLNPDLYLAIDLLAYIPPKGKDIRSYKDYDKLIQFIEKYYNENKSILERYRKLSISE